MYKDAGFTLIEVLIALAILAIALIAVIKVLSQGVNSTAHLKKKIAAHQVALNVLTELQTGIINIDQEGSSNMLGKTLYWQVKPSKEAGDAHYQRVTVTVKSKKDAPPLETLDGFVQLKKE